MAPTKQTIGNYTFAEGKENVLGKGSFGIVFKGVCKDTHAPVAIKRITFRNEDDDKALFNEVRSMDCLQNHRNVVKLLDAQLDIRHMLCWVVMELCELGDLQKYIANNKEDMSLDQRIEFMYQAVLPIAFMHSQNPPIVHRDIKPGNFLLQKNSSNGSIILKVTDFGLAKLFDRSKASETIMLSTQCGTQPYMAPEFWVEGDLDYNKSVDIFSLGLMFLVLLEAKEGSTDYPLTDQARREGYICFYGQELQRAYAKRKPLPLLVEIRDADGEKITAIKCMISEMTFHESASRKALSDVERDLKPLLDSESMCLQNTTMRPDKKIAKSSFFDSGAGEVATMTGVDSGIGDYGSGSSTQDSMGYTMLRSVYGDSGVDVASAKAPIDSVQDSIIEQLRNCLKSETVYGSVFKPGDTQGEFKCEDVVRLFDDESKVQAIQTKCGQWQDDMLTCVGFPGIVTGVEKAKSRVRFINQKSYIFQNVLLTKQDLSTDNLSGGDYVVVKSDKNYVEAVQRKGPGFSKGMTKVIGRAGLVRCIKHYHSKENKADKVKVEHSGKDNYWWSKDALIVVAKGDEIIKALLSTTK